MLNDKNTTDTGTPFRAAAFRTVAALAVLAGAGTPAAELPGGFRSAAVGDPPPAGDTSFDAQTGRWTVTSAGSLHRGRGDRFRFVFRECAGPFTAAARLVSQEDTASAAAAGLMVRVSRDPGAAFVMISSQPGKKKIVWSWRRRAGDRVNQIHFGVEDFPKHLRLTRYGTRVVANYSDDGTTWSRDKGMIINGLPKKPLVGLAVAAAKDNRPSAAVFEQVTVEPWRGACTTSWLGNTCGGSYWSQHVINVPLCLAVDPGTGTLLLGGGNEARDGALYTRDGAFINFYNLNMVSGAAADGDHVYLVGDYRKESCVNRFGIDTTFSGDRHVGTGAHFVGLAKVGDALFVTDDKQGRILVLDAGTMKPRRQFAFGRPGHIAADREGHLWIVRTGEKENPPQVVHVDRRGAPLGRRVRLPDDCVPGQIAVHPEDGRLYVPDKGPRQRVHIYAPDGKRAGAFGAAGGIYSKAFGTRPGQVHPRKLSFPVAAAFDRAGGETFLYVACAGPPESWFYRRGSGTTLRKYDAGGNVVWEKHGLIFVDSVFPAPGSDGTVVYSKHRRFRFDYDAPPGRQWRCAALHYDPFRFPDDPRNTARSMSSAIVRDLDGRRILYVANMNATTVAFYRFTPDSAIAIPCGMVRRARRDEKLYLWIDADGDGRIADGEIDRSLPSLAQTWGFTVDAAGNLWAADRSRETIHLLPLRGMTARGGPRYGRGPGAGAAHRQWDAPPDFRGGKDVYPFRVAYDPAADALYLAGYTKDAPAAYWSWKAAGRVLARYDDWVKGSPTKRWMTDLPYREKKGGGRHTKYTVHGLELAGDYAFTAMSPTGEVFACDRDTGRPAGRFRPGPETAGYSSLVDVVHGLSVVRRRNGEYVIFLEDDGAAKIAVLRWRPRPTARVNE